ncbi:IS66 family transposase [Pleurocapsales cyanobacterium LEGE 10410]|nr:IS66 family transposase [Pleurocapsales cyanobacterium LEGE 10410]
MAQLDKNDLVQMNEDYFKSLKKERLVEVAKNLHILATDLWEKEQKNSQNSSQPPSLDNPYSSKQKQKPESFSSESESAEAKTEQKQLNESSEKPEKKKSPRKPGKQPGAKGFGRKQPLKAEAIIPHYPHQCSACNQNLAESENQRYMGHYVLELEPELNGFRIVCQLHHYYRKTCNCGHCTDAKPGEGKVFVVEGRTRDLKLTEYVLVGPTLGTFIASLGVRYRMSRSKIQEFLNDWAQTELSTGTIDRCIREAGIACVPVVEELVEQLQIADILHLDETHWYESGKLHWLWVAVTTKTAVFRIGSRRKEELSYLVKEAFLGWLVTDGYAAYRSHPKRQRCVAHLIRKAVAITGVIDQKAAQIGQWILDDLRELIATIAYKKEDTRLIRKLQVRLRRACHLGKKADHQKLQALAKEIFNDWDAVVAFVYHPELPPTNNEAERALRHAVIARRIGFGTRTSEGSWAYSSLLSVIETCRLREINPWTYIAEVLALARQGLAPPPFPIGS